MKIKDFRIVDSSKSRSIPVVIMDVYKDYVNYGYPKDPNIYIIRGNSYICKQLSNLSVELLNPSWPVGPDRFMGFRLKVDNSIKDGFLEFGPETEFIKWSE